MNNKKTVLVTGAAKGIGRAIILEFAKLGYNTVINYNTSFEEANKTLEEAKKLGSDSMIICADVTNEDNVHMMFVEIEERFGGVDILVNNAGLDIPNIFNKKNINDFKKVLDVNVIGAFNTSRRAAKYMKDKKWGRIINISSTNGINTYDPTCLEYDASKAALNSLTHNLSMELSPYITVNAVCPGFIGTEAELEGYSEEFLNQEIDKIYVKRVGKPEEVAYLVKFLASDEASYINSSIIRIDGGHYGS